MTQDMHFFSYAAYSYYYLLPNAKIWMDKILNNYQMLFVHKHEDIKVSMTMQEDSMYKNLG